MKHPTNLDAIVNNIKQNTIIANPQTVGVRQIPLNTFIAVRFIGRIKNANSKPGRSRKIILCICLLSALLQKGIKN